ncbi:hypothetical protein RBQ61_16810 [Sedimentibacter sp. MB35-C1]|uniref:hypothetical protein n=1 Tax=Sedimentibacter sp. MB35-C1 TaxID=3070995 RepID=UPI0027DEB846|nr:hypothetical protein [Sedimentibacter sp. MB35-C1]WMJ77209.1 hypothetical protein RBQ61_16810 [Sedimentibacter sp. MB35-C1]
MFKKKLKTVGLIVICAVLICSIIIGKNSKEIGIFSDPPGIGIIINSMNIKI